jgi:hypothetical protein
MRGTAPVQPDARGTPGPDRAGAGLPDEWLCWHSYLGDDGQAHHDAFPCFDDAGDPNPRPPYAGDGDGRSNPGRVVDTDRDERTSQDGNPRELVRAAATKPRHPMPLAGDDAARDGRAETAEADTHRAELRGWRDWWHRLRVVKRHRDARARADQDKRRTGDAGVHRGFQGEHRGDGVPGRIAPNVHRPLVSPRADESGTADDYPVIGSDFG